MKRDNSRIVKKGNKNPCYNENNRPVNHHKGNKPMSKKAFDEYWESWKNSANKFSSKWRRKR